MLDRFMLWITAALDALARLADIRTSALQLPAALFTLGWLLGAAHPVGAWRRGLMLGLSVPLAQGLATLAHSTLPYAAPEGWAAFLALVPALLGSYLGVLSRRAWGEATAPGSPPAR